MHHQVASLLEPCRTRLAARGLNLWGTLDARRFDESQPPELRLSARMPGCRSAIVIGAGGGDLWAALFGDRKPQDEREWKRRLDSFTCATLQQECRELAEAGARTQIALPHEKNPLNFMHAGEEAGLGVVSPVIFLLLHPVYGPWVHLCGAILLDVPLAELGAAGHGSGPIEDFAPCAACHQPCLGACPVGVFDGGRADLHLCATHRSVGECSEGCDVRRACPVGHDHARSVDEERMVQAQGLAMMRRRFGIGAWRFVPGFLRV
jgi:epoxyqueuosine reductase QueG